VAHALRRAVQEAGSGRRSDPRLRSGSSHVATWAAQRPGHVWASALPSIRSCRVNPAVVPRGRDPSLLHVVVISGRWFVRSCAPPRRSALGRRCCPACWTACSGDSSRLVCHLDSGDVQLPCFDRHRVRDWRQPPGLPARHWCRDSALADLDNWSEFQAGETRKLICPASCLRHDGLPGLALQTGGPPR